MNMTIKCARGYDVRVCSSAEGYYIGTIVDGFLYCRISREYYKTKEEAEKALLERTFTFRDSPENMYCNQYLGCNV